MLDLESAIRHCEEVAEEKELICNVIENEGETWTDSGKTHYDICKKCAEEHRQLAEWLKELKQLREQTRWIPTSERLPEPKDCNRYLVTASHYDPINKGGFVMVDYYEARDGAGIPHWEQNQEKDGVRVVAWRPIPEPYLPEMLERLESGQDEM